MADVFDFFEGVVGLEAAHVVAGAVVADDGEKLGCWFHEV